MAFVTAFATLCAQVLVHRLISARLLNNYAFLAVSLTMLGFACSGVVLSRLRERLLSRFDDVVVLCAVLFGFTLIGASAVFCHAPVGVRALTRAACLETLAGVLPLALLFAVPFFFVGLILGLLLTVPDVPVRRVYGFDLAGSGLGALAVMPMISRPGVEWSLLLLATLLPLLMLTLTRAGRATKMVTLAALVVMGGAALMRNSLLRIEYPKHTMLGSLATLGPPYGVEYVAWDPVARIELSRIPARAPEETGFPCLVGDDPWLYQRFGHMLTQNNHAFTLILDRTSEPLSRRGFDRTIYAAAYMASSVPRPRAFVIGVGGGFDVQTALAFDASAVRGVEVNQATLDILGHSHRQLFEPWISDPRVELVQADGRHELSRVPDRFDVIQLSGVDSYAGTPGAAHVFSENYLYTAEAFDLYLSHLTDQGIVNVMRMEFRPEREMLKVLITAVAALRRAGARQPADHIVMVGASTDNFNALLMKRTPFSAAELDRIAAWVASNHYLKLLVRPGTPPANVYGHFLGLGDTTQESAFIAASPFDLRPATDDRPFFFRHSRWSHLWPGSAVRSVPALELTLSSLFVLVGLAVVLCVALPLRALSRKLPPGLPRGRYGILLAAAGVGYMGVEIALMQWLGLLLGHPNYAMSVVLASLLVASGIGALLAERVLAWVGSLRVVGGGVALGVVVYLALVFPRLRAAVSYPFFVRVLLALLLVAPFGLAMGIFLPAALERLRRRAAALVPWAWGVNGIFSVMAPVLAVAISTTWGISVLLLVAAGVYLVAGFSMPEPQ
jgi:hypothetical protein